MDTIDDLRASIATPDCPDFVPMPNSVSYRKNVAEIARHIGNGAIAVANYRLAQKELEDLREQRPSADELARANLKLQKNLDGVMNSMHGAYGEIIKWRNQPWKEPENKFFDGVANTMGKQWRTMNKRGGIKSQLAHNDDVIERMRTLEQAQLTERRLNPRHRQRGNQNHPGSPVGYPPTPDRVIPTPDRVVYEEVIYETPWPAGRSRHSPHDVANSGQIGFTGRNEGYRPSHDTSFQNLRLPNIAQPGGPGMGSGFGQPAGPSVGGEFGPDSSRLSWDNDPGLAAMADSIRYDSSRERSPSPRRSWDYDPKLTAMADEIRYDLSRQRRSSSSSERNPTPSLSPPSQSPPRTHPRPF